MLNKARDYAKKIVGGLTARKSCAGVARVRKNSLPNVYLDNNALRNLGFRTNLPRLLTASKKGVINLYICEAVLHERARQYHNDDKEKIENDQGRILRIAPKNYTQDTATALFKKLFLNYNAHIIEMTPEDSSYKDEVLSDENFYFNPAKPSDVRDALIFSIGVNSLPKNGTIILCAENRLANVFERAGFKVRQDVKEYVTEITTNMPIDVIEGLDVHSTSEEEERQCLSVEFRQFINSDRKYLEGTEQSTDTTKLTMVLQTMGEADIDIRRRVLGYAHWFDPLEKEELVTLLKKEKFSDAEIENNVQRLVAEQYLVDAGDYWLINNDKKDAKEIAQQASTSTMSEVLGIIGL